jgi:hypothetical protein
MMRKDIKEVLDRVLTWPTDRQEDAARVLVEMEEFDASDYRLSDDQVSEVERRVSDFATGYETYATEEEMTALWRKSGL